MLLLCVRALSVPPLTTTSPLVPFQVKSELASDSVKVMVAVWPVASVVLSLVMAMVGGTESVAYWKTTMLAPGVPAPSLVVPVMPVR